MELLCWDGVYKRFGEKEVLKGLSLSVPEHSVFGFVGQNGAGKTTAMKLALGLLKAESGTVRIGGESVQYGQTPTNQWVGYLPDVPEFYSFLTAREYLSLCGKIAGLSPRERESRCRELLELVGLAEEHRRVKGFSRGMKQRLGIAQALLHRPKLLLCDEPTSALDPMGRKDILDLLSAVREQTTVLFSTHILSDVERICTDVAVLHNGKVELQGSLTDLKHRCGGEYLLETENRQDAEMLLRRFPTLREQGEQQLLFKEELLSALLVFLAEQKISPIRLERQEPSLESLFMEVVEQ